MGEAKWTAEQLSAITARDSSLLVAAAAGAGKTAVLVERIIRMITDEKKPVDIDKLLIVTFTNAAAAEMRERIGDAISKVLDKQPDLRSVQRQLTLLNKASITTIHSFCLDVIKSNFHRIDLDPGFRIADETEAVLLKLEALEELFEAAYEDPQIGEDFFALIECYSGSKDDSALQEMVLGIYDFVQSHPWPHKWLEEAAEAFNLPEGTDFGTTSWGEIIKGSIRLELMGLLKLMDRAVSIIQRTQGLEVYLPIYNEDIFNIKALLKLCEEKEATWDDLYNGFNTLEFARLKTAPKDSDKEKQEIVKDIRNEAKEKLKKIKEEIVYVSSGEAAEELRHLYPMLSRLSRLVMDFEALYSAKKREKGIIDFNDLEHFCLHILTEADEEGNMLPSQTAVELRDRFEEIFIDEYQDSNLVQEVILNAISRRHIDRPNIFMVGDVKQSIYRFRQAKPELFMEKYNTYSDTDGEKYRRIKLFKNFRSRGEVLDAVNYIFGQIMSENVGELDYNADEALNLGAAYEPTEEAAVTGGPVELHIIDMKDTDQPSGEAEEEYRQDGEEGITAEIEEEEPDAVRSEARIAIKRIKELMTPDSEGRLFKVYDKAMGQYRSIQYRDITILLRSTKNWAETFVEELTLQGIPAYADTGSGYFKTVEIATIMSLLQIIDNPVQDIPLLSVLRSPIGGFTPEELIDIRLQDREISFYEAMKKSIEEDNEVSKKSAAFLQRLEGWRRKALHMSTDELLWYLYTDTGYYSYAGAMTGGIQRQANLRILFERARQYEETSFKGLFNFINFINKLKGSRGDMGSAKILGENENVVRIMSIHKSKGLEFPVVIVAGTGKSFNLMDMNRSILLHQDLGFGPDFVDHVRRISYPTIPKQALRYKIKLESLSEEMRILYVAFTRAKEKLIITGHVNGIARASAKWKGSLQTQELKLPEYEMLKSRCYLDWIGSALIRHGSKALLSKTSDIDEDSNVKLVDDRSQWQVRLWKKSDILEGKRLEEQEQRDFIAELRALTDSPQSTKYSTEISRRLQWEYPYRLSQRLPVKLTVTELKRHFNTGLEEDNSVNMFVPPIVKRPRFLEESKAMTAAEKGTIQHFVMQHLDLTRLRSIEDIEAQEVEMVVRELLTEVQAKEVNVKKIFAFFQSELGRRLLAADRVCREVPFNIEVASTEIYKDIPELYRDEKIMLQGVIDCYFEEAGELILLDYKTDYVPEGGSEEIKERYRVQIDFYTKALEAVKGRKVKERYIYLFWNGERMGY